MEKNIQFENLIDKTTLEKYNLSKETAIEKVVEYFKKESEHGYFFATISIGCSLNDFISQGGKLQDRLLKGHFKTAIEADYTVDEVCLVFEEFSRISAQKNEGERSSCAFFDICDDDTFNFLGAFEGQKENEKFVLDTILVDDVKQVLTSKQSETATTNEM